MIHGSIDITQLCGRREEEMEKLVCVFVESLLIVIHPSYLGNRGSRLFNQCCFRGL